MRYTRKLTARLSAIHWLGLFWVYSGAGWLLALYLAAESGNFINCLLLTPPLALTLAVGIGLCAGEVWAWSAAMVISVLGAAQAALAAGMAAYSLFTLPSSYLPWLPAFFARTGEDAGRLALTAALVCGVLLVQIYILRRSYAECSTEEGALFGQLARFGLLPAGLMSACTLALLWQWLTNRPLIA